MSADTDVRELLARMAGDAPLPDVARAVKRARRRRVRNVVGAAVILVPCVAIGLRSGLRAIDDGAPKPAAPSTPVATPSPSQKSHGVASIPPPAAATGGAADGRLMIYFDASDGAEGFEELWLYEDGRMVWSVRGFADEGTNPSTWRQQRLTPAGVEALRSEILATGLFEHRRRLAAGTHPKLVIQVRDRSERLVLVGTYGDVSPGEFPDETPEQAALLAHLESILVDPVAWLPATEVVDAEARPYIASRYLLTFLFAIGPWENTVVRPADLPSPFDDLLRSADTVDRFGACRVLTVEEARQTVRLLDASDIARTSPDSLAWSLKIGDSGRPGVVEVVAGLPDRGKCR